MPVLGVEYTGRGRQSPRDSFARCGRVRRRELGVERGSQVCRGGTVRLFPSAADPSLIILAWRENTSTF